MVTRSAKPSFHFKAPAPSASTAPVPPSAPGPTPEDESLFKEEAASHAHNLIRALESATHQPDEATHWESARRIFHTLKGAALTVELTRVGTFASEAEHVAGEAAQDPSKRQAARGGKLLEASRRMFRDLGISIPDPSPRPPAEDTPTPAPPPDDPATGGETPIPSPFSPVEAVSQALEMLNQWKSAPGSDSQASFLAAVETCQQAMQTASQPRLATSFQKLGDFTESVHDHLPPLAHTVIHRSLDDARLFLQECQRNPQLTWNRKWGFYFSSLRIALASESDADPATSGPAGPATPEDAPPEVDPEMLEVFIEEAGGLYDPIESAIMRWEQGREEKDQKAALRRHFHTLKGAANSVGLRSLGTDFHALEDYMETLDTEETPDSLFSFLLRCLDEIRDYVQALESNPASPWQGKWAADIKTLQSGESSPSEAADSTDSPASADTAAASPAPPKEAATLRVDAAQLHNLMNLITEMIADRHRFQDNLETLSTLVRDMARSQEHSGEVPVAEKVPQWSQSLGQVLERFKEDTLSFNRQSKQVQNELAEMNMGPVATLFRRLSRSFRDACQEEQKEATWTTEGENTQLDRTVLEHLYGPLLHVVRNAVAHGIEPPAQREAAGKARTGSVHIAAYPQSNQVILEITDDGAGINGDAVLKRGLERGLVPPGTTSLTHDEVVGLLFMPGFSTKEQVSSVAGRGVGLDVVKGEIEALNGSVGVHYEVGKGTTWKIKVPLSLSASEALLVRVADSHLAIPLSYIDTCIQLKPETIIHSDGRARVQLEEETLPYLALTDLLDLPSETADTHGVIVDSGIDRAVFGVQGLLSRREIVVKDLGPFLEGFSLYSGVTADTDGSLIPILQVPNLLQTFAREFGSALEPVRQEQDPPPLDDHQTVRVLLADDSPSVRKLQERELTKYGFQVSLAEDGAAALKRLEQEHFDLLITDWEMPRLDGEGLIRSLRQHERDDLKNLPVIIISSRVDDDFADHACEIGAHLALPKPFDTHAFHQNVQASKTIAHLARHAATHPAR